MAHHARFDDVGFATHAPHDTPTQRASVIAFNLHRDQHLAACLPHEKCGPGRIGRVRRKRTQHLERNAADRRIAVAGAIEVAYNAIHGSNLPLYHTPSDWNTRRSRFIPTANVIVSTARARTWRCMLIIIIGSVGLQPAPNEFGKRWQPAPNEFGERFAIAPNECKTFATCAHRAQRRFAA